MRSHRYTSEDLNRDRDPWWRRAVGSLRRMFVDLTEGGAWRVGGYQVVKETVRAELFGGIGLYARPRAGAQAEAVVAFVGGAAQPLILATRDESLRQAMCADQKPDETALVNSQVGVYLLADGTIELRSKNGVTKRIATVEDVEAVVDKFNTHGHTAQGATSITTRPVPAAAVPAATHTAPAPVGLDKVRGE